MPAIDNSLSLRRISLLLPVLSASMSLLALQLLPTVAATPELTSGACEAATDATADKLAERFAAEIATRHPDHVARLYAVDGALKGLASPMPRTDYAAVRTYFLYFLQYEPQVKFEARQLQVGCNFLINAGNYTWSLKSKPSAQSENVQARYRFIYEFSDGDWRIAEHLEELTSATTEISEFTVPDPKPSRVVVVGAPAVAGFLQRATETAPHKPQPANLDAKPQISRTERSRAEKINAETPTGKAAKNTAITPAPITDKGWQPDAFSR